MYDLFLDWIGNVSFIDKDILFMFAALASLFILNFLLDFFRWIMYYITRR